MVNEAHETAVQTIHYILSKLGGSADKLKLVKLSFLADKYHLMHHGRTITRDQFVAMKAGPVGSNVLNLIKRQRLPAESLAMAASRLSVDGNNVACQGELDYDLLSESDQEAIDFVIERFGRMSPGALVTLVHKFPEWTRHRTAIKADESRAFPINEVELFSGAGAEFAITPDQAQQTREIYSGQF
jgi:uncharacterized phage-associated protein